MTACLLAASLCRPDFRRWRRLAAQLMVRCGRTGTGRYIPDRRCAGAQDSQSFANCWPYRNMPDGVIGVWADHHLAVTYHHADGCAPRPARHPGQCRRPPDPALSYWSATKIKVPTLTQCVAKAGGTIGAVNWPVTVDAAINWNLPEVYAHRNGDSSDMETVDHFGTPGWWTRSAVPIPLQPGMAG